MEHNLNFCVVRMFVVQCGLCVLQCTDVRQDGDKKRVPFEHSNGLRSVVIFLWVIFRPMKFNRKEIIQKKGYNIRNTAKV